MGRILLFSYLILSLFLTSQEFKSSLKRKHLNHIISTHPDTTTRKNLFKAESCSDYLKIEEVFTIGEGSTEVIEMTEGFFYIHKKGVVDAKSGKLYNLKEQKDRLSLYKFFSDSIFCIRVKGEQHIFNLISDYQYYKKRWTSNALYLNSVETYQSNLIPIFENDTTLLITDLKSGQIITRLSGHSIFSKNISQIGNTYYVANKYLYRINLRSGKIEKRIPLINNLSSNVLEVKDVLFYWDRGVGLKAYDVKRDNVIWEYPSKVDFDIKLIVTESHLYFSDGKIKALDVTTGELLWVDSAGELLVENSNLTRIGDYLLTGYYMDSDAVLAMIDMKTGSVTCNARDLPDETGFYRYTFLQFFDDKSAYGKDDGSYARKLVRFKLLPTID
jgi:hypothetical protein